VHPKGAKFATRVRRRPERIQQYLGTLRPSEFILGDKAMGTNQDTALVGVYGGAGAALGIVMMIIGIAHLFANYSVCQ